MNTKHTPGPWIQNGNAVDADSERIALALGGNFEANARLIAASPELYQALRRLLAMGIKAASPMEKAALDAAEAAIAKATGHEP